MAPGISADPSRRAGVLLHISSLPGPYGIGDLGPAARQALQWLQAAGQGIWQVLPLQPTDHVGSPYASPSAFARNPLLLSIDDLVADGWLRHAEKPWSTAPAHRVDYAEVTARKGPAKSAPSQAMRSAPAPASTAPVWNTSPLVPDDTGEGDDDIPF
jgi:4-alpha-glucanotransferase